MSNIKLKPDIRFKGFTNAWEQYKFDDALNIVTDFVAAGSFADMAENVVYRSTPSYAQLVRTTDLKNQFKNSGFVYVDKKAYDFLWRVQLDEESIVMPNIGNCGEIYYVNGSRLPFRKNVLGPNAILVRSIINNNMFLSYNFLSETFQKELMLIVSPTGQSKFNKTELKTLPVMLPKNREQEKIGELFYQLDTLITLHQRKHDKLANIKMSLLQTMFTSEDEKTPKVRFKGFTNAWELHELGKLISKGGSGGTPTSTNPDYYNGNIPFLSITDITNSDGFIYDTEKHITEDGLNNSAAWIVPKESISLAMYASVGKVAILKENISTSQAFYNLVIDDLKTRDFVFHYLKKMDLNSDWNKLISTGTQANLNAEKVKGLEFLLPKELLERNKIGLLFSNLDHLITLHQRKHEKLINIKKSLLEKMFV